jgi:hypothetical protein
MDFVYTNLTERLAVWKRVPNYIKVLATSLKFLLGHIWNADFSVSLYFLHFFCINVKNDSMEFLRSKSLTVIVCDTVCAWFCEMELMATVT